MKGREGIKVEGLYHQGSGHKLGWDAPLQGCLVMQHCHIMISDH